MKSAFSSAAAMRPRSAEVSDRAPSQVWGNCGGKGSVLLEQGSHHQNSLAGDRRRPEKKTQRESSIPERSQGVMFHPRQIASQLP